MVSRVLQPFLFKKTRLMKVRTSWYTLLIPADLYLFKASLVYTDTFSKKIDGLTYSLLYVTEPNIPDTELKNSILTCSSNISQSI